MYFLKTYVQRYVRWIAGSWMSANMASFFGFITILLIPYLITISLRIEKFQFLLAIIPIIILFRIIFNALDGLLARERGTASILGEIINEILDVLGDTLCFIGLWLGSGASIFSLLFLITLIWIGEFISVLGKSFPRGRRRQESILGGKSERMLFLGLFCFVLYFDGSFVLYTNIFINILSFFVFLTVLKRTKSILKESDHLAYTSKTEFGK